MALFKIITEDEKGNKKLYKEPEDLAKLIYYVYGKSVYFDTYNMFPLDVHGVINQMLYLQSCKGEVLHRRALHFVLSFDTGGWEWEMVKSKVYESIHLVYIAAAMLGVKEYQCCAGVHDTQTHRHIHFVVNPVNCITYKVLHYNMGQYRTFLRELAFMLFNTFGIALEGVSYITENGCMKYGNGTYNSFLYENRCYAYEPLMQSGKVHSIR